MKIQNNKTKTATAIISAFVISLLMLSPTTILPDIQAQTPSSSTVPNCGKDLSSGIRTMADSLNKNEAVSLADSSSMLKTKLEGYNSNFDSIFTQWSWNPSDCSNLKLNDVNVVYNLNDATGNFVKHVIVREDPSLQNVLSVYDQTSNLSFALSDTYNWSGWEIAANSGATTEINVADNQWTVPTISVPSSPHNCVHEPCDVAIWVGLENGFGGSPLVQAGINENITCPSSCTYQYNSWYEVLPGHAPIFSTNTISPTDSVFADVQNEDISNSLNQGLYDITVADNTKGKEFDVSGINDKTAMPTANYGVFMLERANQHNGTLTYLASFTNSTNLAGYMHYAGGANHCITNSGVSSTNSEIKPTTSVNANPSTSISCPGSNGNFNEYYHNDNGE